MKLGSKGEGMEEEIKKYFEFKKNLIDSITLTGEIYNSLLKIIKNETNDEITRQKIEEKIILIKKMANDFFNAFWNFKDQSKPLQEAIEHLRETQILETNKKLQTPLPTTRNQRFVVHSPQSDESIFFSKTKEQAQHIQNIIKLSDSELAIYKNFFKHDCKLFQYLATRLQDYIIFQSFDDDIQKLQQHSNDLNSITTWIETYTQIRDELPKTQTEYNTLKENTKNLYQELELLRQGVISEGLAKRYAQKKISNNLLRLTWLTIMAIGLYLFFQLGNTPVSESIKPQNTPEQQHLSLQSQSLSDYILVFLKKSPKYLALVWLILFASRRSNEAGRLASDYAHKEVFASSYEAYKEEIEKLKKIYPQKADELTELNTKLLDSMIGVLSDNPAKSLDTKKTTDELPAKELVNFASEVIKLRGK